MNNPIEHFKTAMLDAGITPPDSTIGDGVLHRFKIDGQRKAIEAALVIGGKYIIPPIVGYDFNDYLNMEVAA